MWRYREWQGESESERERERERERGRERERERERKRASVRKKFKKNYIVRSASLDLTASVVIHDRLHFSSWR